MLKVRMLSLEFLLLICVSTAIYSKSVNPMSQLMTKIRADDSVLVSNVVHGVSTIPEKFSSHLRSIYNRRDEAVYI